MARRRCRILNRPIRFGSGLTLGSDSVEQDVDDGVGGPSGPGRAYLCANQTASLGVRSKVEPHFPINRLPPAGRPEQILTLSVLLTPEQAFHARHPTYRQSGTRQ